jgi:hypothetical protein
MSYTTELLEELFNLFEENEEGVFFFAGTDDEFIEVKDKDATDILREVQTYFYNKESSSGFDDEDDCD